MAISSSSKVMVAALIIMITLLQGSLAAAGYPPVTCYGYTYNDTDVDYGAAVDNALTDMVEKTKPGRKGRHVQFPKTKPVVFGRSGCDRDCQTNLDTARGYLRLSCPHRMGAYVNMGEGTYMGYYYKDY